MRDGAVISGVVHLLLLLVALFGPQMFSARAPRPFQVTNVELVDGTNFEALVSTAPVVPNEGPAEMMPAAPPEVNFDVATPDASIDAPVMPMLADTELPADQPPDFTDLLVPPPPTVVPTEALRPSIALVPSPDPMTRRAEAPESRPATEPLQPLASAATPDPAPRPAPPPEPAPVAAEDPQPEPDEPTQEPEPQAVAEAQPDAPVSSAPQEARLPVARPADFAAADQASRAPEPTPAAPQPQPEPQQANAQAGGSTSQFANRVTRGEKDALRLGIKKHFVYNGNRADRSLQVTLEIRLSPAGEIVAGPELLRASGGDEVSRNALFKAGQRALFKAQNAGEFARLPADKFEAWELIHVTFTPDERVDFAT